MSESDYPAGAYHNDDAPFNQGLKRRRPRIRYKRVQIMKRTEILCPECMKKKLLKESEESTDLRCDECGTEFTLTAPNTVVYK